MKGVKETEGKSFIGGYHISQIHKPSKSLTLQAGIGIGLSKEEEPFFGRYQRKPQNKPFGDTDVGTHIATFYLLTLDTCDNLRLLRFVDAAVALSGVF